MNDVPAAPRHRKECVCESYRLSSFFILSSLFLCLSLSFLILFHLFHSPILRPLLAGVRIRKCVRHSPRETHILTTNSRSRGLLPCLVVTPNPIFQPEWRVGKPENSMIHASKRFAPDLNAAVHAPATIWEIFLGGEFHARWFRCAFALPKIG